MEIFPPDLSSTTRSTHVYQPNSKSTYEMDAKHKLRWSVQHERPDLLVARNLDWLTRRDNFQHLEGVKFSFP